MVMKNGNQFHEKASKPKYDCLLFDIDDTLYPFNSGISTQVGKNVIDYMIKKLDIDASKAYELCISLYKTYGTTLAGLKAFGYDFDYHEFHSFVHETLPCDNMLKPDPVLKGILQSLPIKKVIFTNADSGHAVRVLHRLGIEDCFEKIISFDTLNSSISIKTSDFKHISDTDKNDDEDESKPIIATIHDFYEHYMHHHDSFDDMVIPRTPVVCKPFEDAFRKVFKIADIDPQKTLFFDDSDCNLRTAKCLGLHTVAVGTSVRVEGVDHALGSIHNIRDAFPELWELEHNHEILI